MNGRSVTLLVILGFVAMVLGSFIWFIVTWDPDKEQSVTQAPVAIMEGRA